MSVLLDLTITSLRIEDILDNYTYKQFWYKVQFIYFSVSSSLYLLYLLIHLLQSLDWLKKKVPSLFFSLYFLAILDKDLETQINKSIYLEIIHLKTVKFLILLKEKYRTVLETDANF